MGHTPVDATCWLTHPHMKTNCPLSAYLFQPCSSWPCCPITPSGRVAACSGPAHPAPFPAAVADDSTLPDRSILLLRP